MIVRLIELGFVLIAVLAIITQFVLPALRNEPLFPFLRKSSEREKREREFFEMNKRIDELVAWKQEKEALEKRLSELETEKKKATETPS